MTGSGAGIGATGVAVGSVIGPGPASGSGTADGVVSARLSGLALGASPGGGQDAIDLGKKIPPATVSPRLSMAFFAAARTSRENGPTRCVHMVHFASIH